MKNKKGFSLVELLAVISIMAVVSLIGFYAYSKIKGKINNENYNQIAKELLVAGEKYTSKTGTQEMTVSDLINAGLLSASDSSGEYKGLDNNDLSCLIIDTETQQLTSNVYVDEEKTTTTAKSKSINDSDLSEWLGTIDCNSENTVSEPIISSKYSLDDEYKIVVYVNSGEGYKQINSASNSWSNYNGTVYAVVELKNANTCPKAESSYKADTVFDKKCKFIGIKSLVISNLPELKGIEMNELYLSSFSDKAVYAVAFDKPEGKNLIFEFTVSGVESGKKNDAQYYLKSSENTDDVVNIDHTSPENKYDNPTKTDNPNGIGCVYTYNVTTKDELSGLRDYSVTYSGKTQDASTHSFADEYTYSYQIIVDYRYQNAGAQITVTDNADNKLNQEIKIDSNNTGIRVAFDVNATSGVSLDKTQCENMGSDYLYENNICIKKVYLLNDATATYGDLPVLSRSGYRFDGWFTSDGVNITKDTAIGNICSQTLYAHWTKIYIIKYDVNGGDEENTPDDQSGAAGEKIKLASADKITKIGETENYNVSYDTNGADSCSTCNEDSATKATRSITYSFAGWTENSISGTVYGENSDYVIPNKNIIMYAKWDSTITPATVILPTPTKAGFSFAGWYDSDRNTTYQAGGTYTVTKNNTVLKASWDANYYNLTYEKTNYTSNCVDVTHVLEGTKWSDSVDSLCTPSLRNGYTFKGWYYKKVNLFNLIPFYVQFDFENSYATDDITLYTKWNQLDEQNEISFTSYNIGPRNIYLIVDASFSTEPYRPFAIIPAVSNFYSTLYYNYDVRNVNVVEVSNNLTKIYRNDEIYTTALFSRKETPKTFAYRTFGVVNQWGTHIQEGFQLVFNDIKNYHSNDNNAIFIFSDGDPFYVAGEKSYSRDYTANYVIDQKNIYKGTKVYSIRFGSSSDGKNFLRKIADGYTETSLDKDSISNAFNQMVSTGETLSTTDLKYTYNLGSYNMDYSKSQNVVVSDSQRTVNCSITSSKLNDSICSYNSSNHQLTIDFTQFQDDNSQISVHYWTKRN